MQAVQDMGKLDNTLVIYISGDNGASPEGTLLGTPNELAGFNADVSGRGAEEALRRVGLRKDVPALLRRLVVGVRYPVPVDQAGRFALGGTRQGVAMSWPARIKDVGGIRNQFSHVIDIVPTVLEACGIAQPQTFDGVPERPIEGVSMTYTWDHANADAPTRHTTQYFEMYGSRAIYHDGWVAAAPPVVPPWDPKPPPPPGSYPWELYNVNDDWTENDDLAQKEPGRLKDLQNLFTSEATKYNVFPLNNGGMMRVFAPKPNPAAGRNLFTYSGELANVGWGAAPSLLDQSYTVTAEIEVPPGGAEGTLVTQGGRFGGYGFYLLKGRPVFTWNVLAVSTTRWAGPDALAPGKHTVAFDFKYDGGASARVARACCASTARTSTPGAWRSRSRTSSRGTKPSMSASTPEQRSRPRTTRCRFASRAS